MKTDNLYFDAQHRLKKGIDKVAKAVSVTMGTSGSNAIIEAMEHPFHLLTNDGYTIANSILLADPIEDMGRKILLESINRANKASGDGSSTTCVLTSAIIEEGMKRTEHPMDLKRSIEDCLPIVEEQINSQKKTIVSEDGVIDVKALEQVASISAEDAEIGARIAEIYTQIGNKGIIHWDISKTTDDQYVIGSGITIEGATYLSPYMCDATENGQSTSQIRLKKPKILITKQKIASASDFNNIALALHNSEVTDLVVFADEVEPLVIPDLIKTRLARGFRIAIVKMPVLWKDWWYEDLAKASGAKVIDPAAGLPMKMLTMEHLGTVDNLLITKTDTYLDGLADLTDHIKELESDGSDDAMLRASRLNTKTARYYVGAQSDSALSYRRLKVEDAISAAWHALNGGIVAGGGSALASIELPKTAGGEVLYEALSAPARAIARNAGFPDLPVGYDYKGGRGFDSRSKTFVNMFEAGITDPATITLNAVKNAISVAATVLTAPTVITIPREAEPERPQPPVII